MFYFNITTTNRSPEDFAASFVGSPEHTFDKVFPNEFIDKFPRTVQKVDKFYWNLWLVLDRLHVENFEVGRGRSPLSAAGVSSATAPAGGFLNKIINFFMSKIINFLMKMGSFFSKIPNFLLKICNSHDFY